MAKRVAVIDIGSNSVRMVIYEKTSRFAFHLLYETKTKVRISEYAYQNNGNLQAKAMKRAFDALRDFVTIIESFKVRKTLCVATSALRDAPNKKEFIDKVKLNIKLNIKVITGEREAYLGALSCANLLPAQKNALSIDIGGGSTELSIINNQNISNTISLKLGTVRLKELFFDKKDINKAIVYIDKKLEVLDGLNISSIVGIGGTFRAISIAIMKDTCYPLRKVHGFECKAKIFDKYLSKILDADEGNLKDLYIKKNRFDIIKPGALILSRITKKLKLTNVITSGVGVREGVYLSDLLRNSKDKLPHNYNTSVRYILDTFIDDTNFSNMLNKLSKNIFDLIHVDLNIDKKYRKDLAIASKLYISGSSIDFYIQDKHSYQIIKSALEFGFTHKEIMLIATLCKYATRKFALPTHIDKYKSLLPDEGTLNILIYILSLSIALLSHKPRSIDFSMKFKDMELLIETTNTFYLSKEAVKKLNRCKDFNIKIFAP